MQVSADIRRSDVVRLNLYLVPRQRGTWIMLGIIAAGVFIAFLAIAQRLDFFTISFAAATGILAGLAGVLAGNLCAVVSFLARANEKSGQLGPRTYTLRDDGVQYQSVAADSIVRWTAIDSLRKTEDYVFIGLTSSGFWIVPRRAFPSLQAFDEFWAAAHKRWQAAPMANVFQ
jgi:YcxB-like protein